MKSIAFVDENNGAKMFSVAHLLATIACYCDNYLITPNNFVTEKLKNGVLPCFPKSYSGRILIMTHGKTKAQS